MSSAAPWVDQSDVLSLGSIRDALIRQEDTIIFALIERAQFAHNPEAYNPKSEQYSDLMQSDEAGTSLMQHMLLEQERIHASIRRYTSPDEHAFFPHRLPAPKLPLIEYPSVLHPSDINLNREIMNLYTGTVIPNLCKTGDDGNHGSSVVADIAVLQAVSKRVHYGFFVAESKFRGQTAEYTKLIEARDEEGIMKLLTNAAVEEAVLRRVRLKASTFGQELAAPPPASETAAAAAKPPPPAAPHDPARSSRINPELMVQLYRDHVIPMTKVAEVQYLLQRLIPAAVAHHGEVGSVCARAAGRYVEDHFPVGRTRPPLVPCPNVADVFEAVSSNRAKVGLALLEQGQSGVLANVRELLTRNSLRIVGEVLIETRFRLVARPWGTRANTGGKSAALSDVTRVVASADTLRTCHGWLRALLSSSVELTETDERSPDESGGRGGLPSPVAPRVGAKRTASEGLRDGPGTCVAYLVQSHVALAPDVCVLATAPEDVVEHARCVVLQQSRGPPIAPTGRDRTILYFSLKQQVGSLAHVLDAIMRHGVNLLNIRSYEVRARAVDFIVTAEGHEMNPKLAGALSELRSLTDVLKVFGSFPTAHPPRAIS